MIKIFVSFDTHIIIIIIIIIIMQDGDQDGCHNHNIRGILLSKRHSSAAYKQSLVFGKPMSCCLHNNEVL